MFSYHFHLFIDRQNILILSERRTANKSHCFFNFDLAEAEQTWGMEREGSLEMGMRVNVE